MHYDKKKISSLQLHMQQNMELWASSLDVPFDNVKDSLVLGYGGLFPRRCLVLCRDLLLEVKLKNCVPVECQKRLLASNVEWNILNEADEEFTTVTLHLLHNNSPIYDIPCLIGTCSLETTDSAGALEYCESAKQRTEIDSKLAALSQIAKCLSLQFRNTLAVDDLQSKLQEIMQLILGVQEDTLLHSKREACIDAIRNTMWAAGKTGLSSEEFLGSINATLYSIWHHIVHSPGDWGHAVLRLVDFVETTDGLWSIWGGSDKRKAARETIWKIHRELRVISGCRFRGIGDRLATLAAHAISDVSVGAIRADKAYDESKTMKSVSLLQDLMQALKEL